MDLHLPPGDAYALDEETHEPLPASEIEGIDPRCNSFCEVRNAFPQAVIRRELCMLGAEFVSLSTQVSASCGEFSVAS